MQSKITVVVPVLNAARTVGDCARALLAQDHPRDLHELVFVDNGSTDGSREALARLGVPCLLEPRPGPARARNHGIERSRAELVAFTDADCVPTRSWLGHLARGFADPEVNVTTGTLAVLDPRSSAIAAYSAMVGQYGAERTLGHPRFPYAPTGNVAIRRSVLAKIGQFDPDFPTYEGADLFYRMRRAGLLSFRIEPRAAVFYRTRATVPEFWRQNFRYGRDYARFCHKHRDALERGPARLPRALATWMARLRQGSRGLARGGFGRSGRALLGVHLVRETALLAGALSYRNGGRER